MRVRCTNANVWKDGALRTCGWRGERFEVYQPPSHPELVGPGEWAVNLDKPCPRCGGKVEQAQVSQ